MKTLEGLSLAEEMDNGESSAKMDVLKQIIQLAEQALGGKLKEKSKPPEPSESEGGSPVEADGEEDEDLAAMKKKAAEIGG